MTNRIIDLPTDPDLRGILRDQIDSLQALIETGDTYAMGQLDMAKAIQALLKNLAVPVVRTKADKPTDWQAEARKAANDFVRAKTPADRAKATERLSKAQAEIAKAKAGHVSENAVAVGCAAVAAPVAVAAAPLAYPDRLPNCIGRGAGQHNEHCYVMRQWLVAKQA